MDNKEKLKPGPKPQPEKRYIKTFIKLHPQVVAWARRQAKIHGIGYQTVINRTLLARVLKNSGRTEETI